jgi:hypothetical protein
MSMPQQNYEDYWRLTNAFTNYNGDKFRTTLAICVDFIDEFNDEKYSEEKYSRLQERIEGSLGINLISIRKAINQLVKMGFINSFLISYHILSKDYVEARTNKKRQTLLSRIVYSNSSFNRAVNNTSDLKQINFLVQTLIEKGKLSKEEIIALMLVDIETYNSDFISGEDLKNYVLQANKLGFTKRKYNQVGYLYNLLNKLEDLVFVEDDLYFREDAEQIFGEDLKEIRKKRDPYLHRLYKNELQEEAIELYGNSKCMLEKLSYPVLIASHIKPFIKSDEIEAYDPNNGLLLSRTIDSLFDLKYISFSNEGQMLFSSRISADVKEFWGDYKLEENILNDERKQYLAYHRELMTQNDERINV